MKALILNAMGQKEEAFALGKTALRNDMKSHICWHVYGLLYKDERNFEESLKAYRFALKIKPDSSDIQRDLAHLQIQIRDFSGYIQSRRAMLKAQPTLRTNWTALAVAQHLAGDLEDAEKTLSMYEDILKVPPPKTDIEHQQALLYKNMIIAETENYERALEHLDIISKLVYDKQLVMELRADYLLKLNRFSEAEKIYRILINRNQENRSYFAGLVAALQLSESQPDKLTEMYAEIASKFPRADAPRRIPLDFLKGEEFRKAADDYLRRMLTKGVPSTFSNIKTLYQDNEKQAAVEKLVLGYAEGHTPNNTTDEKAAKEKESFHGSVLYFLAQHYNYYTSRDIPTALRYIDQLIEKEPKSVDYSMIKARILKNLGDTKGAAQMMDQARSFDERDRYINTKSAKYQLRNNDHTKALDTIGKFIKADATGGPLGETIEMQYVWFLTEDGEAYLREKKLGLALKRFNTIYNIFDLWQEDQFDFHSYALRKRQIRAYIYMIKWEDQLRSHPLFTRASIAACKAYILLHDQPQLAKDEPLVNGTSADSKAKKKAAQKAKKEQEKTESEADKKAKATKKDLDPEGKQLLETQEPLKDAMKFLTPILESSPKSLPVQEVGFEIFLRRSTSIPNRGGSILTVNREISSGLAMPPGNEEFGTRVSSSSQSNLASAACIRDLGNTSRCKSFEDIRY